MYRSRVIPVLLLKDLGLVKSVQFGKYRYIGDPINAVKIFNDLVADELVFLDILANQEKRRISLDFVRKVGAEANMPFGVGGGIKSLDDIQEVLAAGAEKAVLNTFAMENPTLVREAANEFGTSTITVSMDVKKRLFKGERVFTFGGRRPTRWTPVEWAMHMQDQGAGELVVNSIERDGKMEGYDLDLIRSISECVSIPVVALGGAGTMEHLREALEIGCASAVAAGSMFVYHGPRRAVLINYPDRSELMEIVGHANSN